MTNSSGTPDGPRDEEIDLTAKIIGKDTFGWDLPENMNRILKESLGGPKKIDAGERFQKIDEFMKKMDDTAKGHE